MNLDDSAIIYKYDRSGMLGRIESFPEQCLDAKEIGLTLKAGAYFKIEYKNIVCTGMGGSGIGADILRSYISNEANIPFFVNRDYALPAFVGKKSLVVASSYSGDTEETLSAYKDARAKGAKIIAITSGGELKKMARDDSFPVIAIPKGLPPRCALGYSFFPLLILLSKIRLVNDKAKSIDEVAAVLGALRKDSFSRTVPEDRNPAKNIARRLHLKYPVIYAASRMDCVATRWRGQLAENSKTLSSTHTFPEMCHNEIVGWHGRSESVLKKIAVIMLRDSLDHRRTAKRMDIVKNMLEKDAGVIEARSSGDGLLARIFSLVYMGDFVSFYLAVLNKQDSTPVDSITYLKKELAKEN